MKAILIRLTVARFVLRIARCFAELIAPEIKSPSQRAKLNQLPLSLPRRPTIKGTEMSIPAND